MGLFTNNKKLCPICGNPTPRLLATKIEDQPICKECDGKIDLPAGAVNQMSLTEFKEYLTAFGENQALQNEFNTTYHFSIGFWGASLYLDEAHGLFRLKDGSGWAFEGKDIKAFRISEDGRPLYESTAGALKCTASTVPELVTALAPQIAQFHMERQEFQRREAMEGLHHAGRESNEERREREQANDLYRPKFDVPAPMEKFRIEITLNHPYWKSFDEQISGPEFDRDYPRAEDYMKSYREKNEELHLLASKLMHMMDPNAGEVQAGAVSAAPAAAAAAAPADAVSEIRKYKELLDAGALTEEEFAAKKRQLLGI